MAKINLDRILIKCRNFAEYLEFISYLKDLKYDLKGWDSEHIFERLKNEKRYNLIFDKDRVLANIVLDEANLKAFDYAFDLEHFYCHFIKDLKEKERIESILKFIMEDE